MQKTHPIIQEYLNSIGKSLLKSIFNNIKNYSEVCSYNTIVYNLDMIKGSEIKILDMACDDVLKNPNIPGTFRSLNNHIKSRVY